VVRELRSGDSFSGMETLYDSVGIIEWYVNLVTALDVMFSSSDPDFRLDPGSFGSELLDPGQDLGSLSSVGGSEMATFVSVENLRDKLLEMEAAQEKNDLQLLADILEYEVAPIVAIWAREAPVLLAKVRREGASA
jgi:hypothetical protein